MRFTPTDEQADFARTLDRLLGSADPVRAARAWADGDTGPGLALWSRLAEQGVHALLVPEEHGGSGATPVELVLALEAIGRHGAPGPWVESTAFLPAALADQALLGELAEGAVGTVAAPPASPYALDGAVADHLFLARAGELRRATPGAPVTSIDRTRRLVSVSAGDPVAAGDLDRALDLAALGTAAQLLGAGERVLADTVDYVKQRRQFGREIGSYQALKHQLADVRIALDFARPLVHGAAVQHEEPDFARDVSAARVAAGDAAYRATRVGLQLHGAIGYTAEFDLSLWILKVRALVAAWGSQSFHRARVLDALVGA